MNFLRKLASFEKLFLKKDIILSVLITFSGLHYLRWFIFFHSFYIFRGYIFLLLFILCIGYFVRCVVISPFYS